MQFVEANKNSAECEGYVPILQNTTNWTMVSHKVDIINLMVTSNVSIKNRQHLTFTTLEMVCFGQLKLN